MTQNEIIHYVTTDALSTEEGEGLQFPGWYFWNETQADRNGPYNSKAECEQALETYLDHLG